MSIVSEVNRLKDAKTAIKTAIEGKGVTVPDATMLEGMAALIDSIEAGGGGIRFATGTFIPDEDALSYTITHGLDVTPDMVIYWSEIGTTVAKTMIFGVNAVAGIIDVTGSKGPKPPASAAQFSTSEVGTYFWGPNSTISSQKKYLNETGDASVYAPYCAPHSANDKTFTIGINGYYVRSGMSYRWIAISGVK